MLNLIQNLGTDELALTLREANSHMTIAKAEMEEAKRFNQRLRNGKSSVRKTLSVAVYRERRSDRNLIQREIDTRREDITASQEQVESILNRYAFRGM